MKVFALVFVMIVMLAGIAQAEFVLPNLDLQIAYVNSLDNGENQVCLIAGWTVAKAANVPFQLDVLFCPDFQTFGQWGIGGSVVLSGISSNLKLGLGCLGGIRDPVMYVAFTIN